MPESYKISAGKIAGADARGLMYGLIAAAQQIRSEGKLTPAQDSPRTPIRGIRYFIHNADLESRATGIIRTIIGMSTYRCWLKTDSIGSI